jgi:hypothetical protein
MVSFILRKQPTLAPRILLVRCGETLVCVAPFYLQPAGFSFEFSVWRTRPIPAKVLRIFGESVVLAEGLDADWCVSIIGDYLRLNSSSCDFLQVYGLNQSDRVWHAALARDGLSRRAGWAAIPMRPEKTHRVLFKDSFDEYVASLSPSTRQTLRYSHRRLLRDPEVRIEKCTRAGDVSLLLHRVNKVYSDSWQAKTFGNHSQYDVAQQEFLEQTAGEGWLRSYVLLRSGEPIAYQLGFQYDRVYYLLECAYGQQHAAASPGSVLTFSVLEDLHADKSIDQWDFGFGDMPYKRSFSNRQYEAAIVYFVPRGRWRFILRLQQLLNTGYDAVRTALVRLRIDKFVRKLVKRQR